MLVISILIAAAVAVIDQVIKYFILVYLKPAGTVTLIPGLLNFTYVENRGVAFGMFSNMRWLFIIFTSVVIIALSVLLVKTINKSRVLTIGCALIIGGGIGNLIDRIFLTYVVDYISLSFFPPVCNFADYCITAGTVLIVIYLLFIYKSKGEEKVKNEEYHN